MADPVSVGLAIGIPLIGGIFDALTEDERERALREVLEEQQAHSQRLERFSRGEFSDVERRTITAESAPIVEGVSASLARRGLARSPASARPIAQARQAPFLATQTAALGAIPSGLAAQAQTASLLPQGGAQNFFQGVGTLARNFRLLQSLGGSSPEVDSFIRSEHDSLQGQGFFGPLEPEGLGERLFREQSTGLTAV